MFREMRRNKQALEQSEIIKMLDSATNGILAVQGDDDYPYAVPLSFAYDEGKIYFHSTTGVSHKIDAIKNNPKVSFCVVTQDEIIASDFNTIYKSAIAFGTAKVLTEDAEIMHGIMAITQKYSGEYTEKGREYAEKSRDKFCIVEIKIEHMTGKMGF